MDKINFAQKFQLNNILLLELTTGFSEIGVTTPNDLEVKLDLSFSSEVLSFENNKIGIDVITNVTMCNSDYIKSQAAKISTTHRVIIEVLDNSIDIVKEINSVFELTIYYLYPVLRELLSSLSDKMQLPPLNIAPIIIK
jgi:preprotein translocase subunit SecB